MTGIARERAFDAMTDAIRAQAMRGFEHDRALALLRCIHGLTAFQAVAPDQDAWPCAEAFRGLDMEALVKAPALTPIGIVGKLALVGINLARDAFGEASRDSMRGLALVMSAIADIVALGGAPIALPPGASRPIDSQAAAKVRAAASGEYAG